MKKNSNIIVFLLIIFSLSLISLLKPITIFSDNENRYLTQKPKYSWKDLKSGKYTQDYENFIIDQFVFRDNWISLKTLSERFMQKQDIKSVYLGKEGYLIERHNENNIDKQKKDKNIKALVEFLNRLNKDYENNIKLMMVPTASEILGDKLPPFANGFNQSDLLEEIAKGLNNKDIIIKIEDALISHNDEYIYYKTDHHWTTLGAYYAYVEWAFSNNIMPIAKDEFDIIEASNEFYGTLHSKININLAPDTINLYNKKDMQFIHIADLEEQSESLYDMSKLDTKDKYSVFLGGNHALDEITTNNENGKGLLIIKDSYAHSILPFIANHYEKVYLIDLRYININIDTLMQEKKITDVLVLYNIMNYVNDNNTSKLR